jgi:hypothetical protein
MKKFCALIPLLAALPTVWGCAGTKPVQSSAGEGGSGAVGSGTGGSGGGLGSGGSGGNAATGTGGGTSTTGAGGDVGPATDAGTPNCGLQQFQPTPKNADILLVLDRSASMQDPINSSSSTSKWTVVVPTLNNVVDNTDTSVLWGMKSFPEGSGSECTAGSVTSNIDVEVAATDASAVTAAITATTPDGNGTPTGDAINAAVAYLKTLSDTNPKYILLATDGEPSCAAIPSSENTTAARPYAVTAVTNAKTAGFPTFVIGIGTTASDTTTLNQLADAGGEVPAGATNPLSPHFYLASDMTTLTAALGSITGQISSCLFPLKTAPPVLNDGTKVGVYVGTGMTRIPYDATNGWTYTDTSDSTVEVNGSWCNMIQAAGAGAVQIIFGCPSINPPG